MSCNTRCYKKCKIQYPAADIMVLFKNYVEETQDNCERIIAGNFWTEEELKNINLYYPYDSKEEAENYLITLNWFIDNIENVLDFEQNYEDDIKHEVNEFSREGELYALFYSFSCYNEYPIAHYDEQTQSYYEEVDYGNNLFRGLNYDAPNLYSRKETLNYIKNNKHDVIDVNYDKINEFWIKYSDGMILFG